MDCLKKHMRHSNQNGVLSCGLLKKTYETQLYQSLRHQRDCCGLLKKTYETQCSTFNCFRTGSCGLLKKTYETQYMAILLLYINMLYMFFIKKTCL